MERVYHNHYRMVFIMFSLLVGSIIQLLSFAPQAVLAYGPEMLWNSAEGGRICSITKDMQLPELVEGVRAEKTQTLLSWYRKYKNKNQRYSITFAILELAILGVALLEGFIINWVLGGGFMLYGIDVIHFMFMLSEDETWLMTGPHTELFPPLAKCDFFMHSIAGQIDKSDWMCHLPLNSFYEVIFFVIWCILILQIALTCFVIVYRYIPTTGNPSITLNCRLMVIVSPRFRCWRLWKSVISCDQSECRFRTFMAAMENVEVSY